MRVAARLGKFMQLLKHSDINPYFYKEISDYLLMMLRAKVFFIKTSLR